MKQRFKVSKEELMKHGLALPTSGGFNVEPDEFTVLEGVPEATTGEKNWETEFSKRFYRDTDQNDRVWGWLGRINPDGTRSIALLEDVKNFIREFVAPKTSGECCYNCLMGSAMCEPWCNDPACPCHSVTEECHCQPGYKCLTHRVTEVKHIGDDKCYGQPCNHDGTTKCGLPVTEKKCKCGAPYSEVHYTTSKCGPVTAKEGECKGFCDTCLGCPLPHFARPTSTQKEKIEELSYDNGVDMKSIIDKTNEVIRAFNKGITRL